MILPYFDYADIVYDGCVSKIQEKLQKLQNRALRIVLDSCNVRISIIELQRLTDTTSLITRRKIHLLNFMYKRVAKHGDLLTGFTTITRAGSKRILTVLFPRLEKTKNAISFKGHDLWNSISLGHQLAPTYSSFKNLTKLLYKDNYLG
jgi:hypothetical protein